MALGKYAAAVALLVDMRWQKRRNGGGNHAHAKGYSPSCRTAGMESKGEENDDDGSSRFYLTLNSFEIVPTYPLQKNQESTVASNCYHYVIPCKKCKQMISVISNVSP
jgi:hypothetical protein